MAHDGSSGAGIVRPQSVASCRLIRNNAVAPARHTAVPENESTKSFIASIEDDPSRIGVQLRGSAGYGGRDGGEDEIPRASRRPSHESGSVPGACDGHRERPRHGSGTRWSWRGRPGGLSRARVRLSGAFHSDAGSGRAGKCQPGRRWRARRRGEFDDWDVRSGMVTRRRSIGVPCTPSPEVALMSRPPATGTTVDDLPTGERSAGVANRRLAAFAGGRKIAVRVDPEYTHWSPRRT